MAIYWDINAKNVLNFIQLQYQKIKNNFIQEIGQHSSDRSWLSKIKLLVLQEFVTN